MKNFYDCIIIGGGASGFFFAINYAERHPEQSILIIEKSNRVLQKVKISGGGRCNVTHAEFEPKPLTTHYPRGEKELIGPFHQFMSGDMMAWLEDKGVNLKIEDDGRIFPVTNDSQTIIDCFINEVNRLGVQVKTSENVLSFEYQENIWNILAKNNTYKAKQLVISTGSSQKIWVELARLGHQIIKPVPSLFTFNIDYPTLTELQGLSLNTHIKLFKDETCKQQLLSSEGATLITHWGLSGPCVLKLSAWGAIKLNALNYNCYILINWIFKYSKEDVLSTLKNFKIDYAKKNISNRIPFNLPKRFWFFVLKTSKIETQKNWADLSKKDIQILVTLLTAFKLEVKGKSTFKEEFVTAGGVDLKEIDFKTYSSKKQPYLKIIGEALNIDAITGGFNFQNAWTSAYVAANNL